MKKFFALLVLSFMLALAGTAFATDGGHVIPPTPVTPDESGSENDRATEAVTQDATVTETVEVDAAAQEVTTTVTPDQATQTPEQAASSMSSLITVNPDGTWDGVGQTDSTADADGSKSALSAVLNFLNLSGDPDGASVLQQVVKFFQDVAVAANNAATKIADQLAQSASQQANPPVPVANMVVREASSLNNATESSASGLRVPKQAPSNEEVAAKMMAAADNSTNSKQKERLTGKTPFTVIPPVEVTQPGFYKLTPPTAKPEMYDKEIHYTPLKTLRSSNRLRSSISVAALLEDGDEPDETAAFFNSNGEEITRIPGSADIARKIVPGYYTIVTYMDPDYEYTPVVSTPTDVLESEGFTEKKEVTVTTEVVVVSDADGYWTTSVDLSLFAAEEGSENYKRLVNAVSTGWNLSNDFPAMNSYLTDPDGRNERKQRRLPKVVSTDSLVDEYWYVLGVKYNIPSSADLGENEIKEVDQPLRFYHNVNVSTSALTTGTARFLKRVAGGVSDITYSDIIRNQGKTIDGYLAMRLPSTANPSEYYPYVTLLLETSDSPSPTPTPYRRGGGGGCSAGWSALALVMLSGLALVSKKK